MDHGMKRRGGILSEMKCDSPEGENVTKYEADGQRGPKFHTKPKRVFKKTPIGLKMWIPMENPKVPRPGERNFQP